MKNNLGLVGFIAVIFLTFGITYLDFDNLNFGDNYKAYAMLIIGIILFIIMFYKSKKKIKP
ncbi:hypothetical protein [Winogradskyella ludwigii]|jgi:hypothetical protein|uniref:hypothetical protein n=1 Tax=Winogradskyella ludwigii TaxID=2686076 RepID=UPI0015C8A3D7|nr:hypothetical protein [Winogradskyella ludwigii]